MYHFSLLLFHLSDGISNHGNSSRIVATTTKSAPQTLSYMSCKSTDTMLSCIYNICADIDDYIQWERRRWGGDLSSLFSPLLFLPFSLLLPPFSPFRGDRKVFHQHDLKAFRRPDNSSREGGSRGLNLLTFLYFLNRIQQIWPTPTRKPMRALTEADISHDGPSLSGPASWFVGGVSLINRIVFSHTRQ